MLTSITVHHGTRYNNCKIIIFDPDKMALFVSAGKNSEDDVRIPVKTIQTIEIATDENVRAMNPLLDLKKIKSQGRQITGWGMMFGLMGTAGELLVKGINITFIMRFNDGEGFLATMGEKAFNKMKEGIADTKN